MEVDMVKIPTQKMLGPILALVWAVRTNWSHFCIRMTQKTCLTLSLPHHCWCRVLPLALSVTPYPQSPFPASCIILSHQKSHPYVPNLYKQEGDAIKLKVPFTYIFQYRCRAIFCDIGIEASTLARGNGPREFRCVSFGPSILTIPLIPGETSAGLGPLPLVWTCRQGAGKVWIQWAWKLIYMSCMFSVTLSIQKSESLVLLKQAIITETGGSRV